MTTLRAILAIMAIIVALYFVAMNWWALVASERNKKKGIAGHHSTVPLVSFVLAGLVAYPLYPFTPKSWIGLIPLVDIGNWALIIGLPYAMAKGAFRKKSPDKE